MLFATDPSSLLAGEFGELLLAGAGGYILEGESGVSASPEQLLEVLQQLMRRPGLSAVEREYTLTALMKLSAHVPGLAPSVQARSPPPPYTHTQPAWSEACVLPIGGFR